MVNERWWQRAVDCILYLRCSVAFFFFRKVYVMDTSGITIQNREEVNCDCTISLIQQFMLLHLDL